MSCITLVEILSLMKNQNSTHIPRSQMKYMKKAYKMIDISLQSKHLMEGFMKKIKKSFKYDEKNQKVKLN